MKTIIIKRDKRLRKQSAVISLVALVLFLSTAMVVINLSVFLAVFLGLIGLLYLFSFIKDKRIIEEPVEIIFSDRCVFFNAIGTFDWDDINALEVKNSLSYNEYSEKSTSVYLHVLLENRESFYFPINFLEKNENEIMALFMEYKPILLKSHF